MSDSRRFSGRAAAAIACVVAAGGIGGYFVGGFFEKSQSPPPPKPARDQSSREVRGKSSPSESSQQSSAIRRPLNGKMYAINQNLVFADGDIELAGMSFATAAPSGAIVFVTAAHLFDLSGPRLVGIEWFVSGGTKLTGTRSFGKPLQLEKVPLPDRRRDFLIVAPDVVLKDENLNAYEVEPLALDARDRVAKGERVWFPFDDILGDAGAQLRLVPGTVVNANPAQLTISLDEDILLAGGSGTPIISQTTNSVIGIACEMTATKPRPMVLLTPVRGIIQALKKGDSSDQRPLLVDVIGQGRKADFKLLEAEEKSRKEEADKLRKEFE